MYAQVEVFLLSPAHSSLVLSVPSDMSLSVFLYNFFSLATNAPVAAVVVAAGIAVCAAEALQCDMGCICSI